MKNSYFWQRFWNGYFWGAFALAMFVTCCAASCMTSPSAVINEVISIVSGILPIVTGVAATLLPNEAALLNSVTADSTAALKALQTTVAAYEANPGTTPLTDVQNAFTASQTNLTTLLEAAKVKNPATNTKITAIVNGVLLTISMLESQILAKHPATVAAAAATAQSAAS